MDQLGPWYSTVAPDNYYRYNGKEFDEGVGLYDYGARYYDPAVARWTGIDPLAGNYPEWSPYNYVFGNPIQNIDPDGRSVDNVIITGDQANQAVAALNENSNLVITRNEETGKLSASGKAKTRADKKLLSAIKDENITVELVTTSNQTYDSKDGTKNIPLLPGGFEGSEVGENNNVKATQMLNVNNAEIISDLFEENTGSTITHEINEAYFGALQNPGGNYDSAYAPAHDAAKRLDPSGANHTNLDLNNDKSTRTLYIRKRGGKEWISLGKRQ